jgi:DNA processing protein
VLEAEHGLLAGAMLESATAEIRSWQRQGIRALTQLDPEYPANLRAAHDRPPLVFVEGNYQQTDARSVAVIGSRRASSAGLLNTERIARHLVIGGYAVVSGLAAGIDTAAHTAALAGGGRTIAVLGTGVRRSYPPENAPLQRRIAAEGAVISQFLPDAPPEKRSFPMRNAVMSGLTLATVIVEASPTSGARTQARLALAQRRPVLLLRQLLTQDWAVELAGRAGVHVIDEPAAIADLLEREQLPSTFAA